MAKKSSFERRSESEIRAMKPKQIYRARGLVEKIWNSDPCNDAFELRFPLIPTKFRANHSDARASRLNYKHGNYLALSQPKTQEEAYRTKETPLAIRQRDFDSLRSLREEETFLMGYRFHPVQGRDRRWRYVPFVWLPEGVELFGYAESVGGIEIEPYTDSKGVSREGASILTKVPSRTKKKKRYGVKLMSVPVDGVTEKRAVAWSLKSLFEDGEEPEHSGYNIRYTPEKERGVSDVFTFYPHTIAAYIAVIKYFNSMHNLTPIEMSPLALISRNMARFNDRLDNNVLIYDPTLKAKEKTRHLHLDEKSTFNARAIGIFGHDGTMYWDPARDGLLKDYFLS